MKSVIVGAGEVGTALYNILKDYYSCVLVDTEPMEIEGVDILHICFPYSKNFKEEVDKYRLKYCPDYTIIHSTVPPGTSRKCDAIHSPVIGIHPYLEKSIKTFVKFIGGEKAQEVSDYFRRTGMKVYLFDKQEITEAMKILDTTFYGACIEYVKDVKRVCEEYKIPFEAWTIWTDMYNEGYQKLGYPEYTRPNLVPIMKKIGGHCILPNSEMIETKFTKLIRLCNKKKNASSE